MASCDSSLLSKLRQGKPSQKVNLIIHPAKSTSLEQAAGLLKAAKVEVRHLFSLTHSLAAKASVSQALKLVDSPWVSKIEEDKSVRAM